MAAAAPKEAQQWLLAKRPLKLPVLEGPDATFKLHTAPLPPLKDDQVLVKTMFMSNDPAQRTWISGGIDSDRLYTKPVSEGSPMRATGVAEVLESTSARFKQGDRIRCSVGWTSHSVHNAADCLALAPLPRGLSDSHYLGSVGLTGLTAYYGLCEIAAARPTDRVIVSGAAGATGSMVVQIAKHIVGCRQVIGIAGTPDKCRWVESLGADVCLDYRAADFEAQLRAATDGFAQVYFDNVGGPVLDAVLARLAPHARIAACGCISRYNAEGEAMALKNWFQVVSNKITIQGFIVTEAQARFPEFLEVLTRAIADGRITVDDKSETVVPTPFKDVPRTWLRLFEGQNQGKLVTAVQH